MLLPTRGAAAIMAPGIATERHVQLGARRAAAAAAADGTVAEGTGGESLAAAAEAAHAAYAAGEAPGMSLRITLTGDEWRAGLLAYAVEEYEVCIHRPKENTTFEHVANISLCNGSFPNVSNASNGSCAYNASNASGGIAWGYPYRVESAVTPGGDPAPYLSDEQRAQLLMVSLTRTRTRTRPQPQP